MSRTCSLDLNDFFFVQVVDRGGFTAAGRTLRVPKSTLSHRIQHLETNLVVRLLSRTSSRFGMTDAGREFYRHAVTMLREAELAQSVIRHRLSEPTGTVRCTAAVATMQFAMRSLVTDFLVRHPKVNVVAHATDEMSTSSAKISTLRSERTRTHFRIQTWCNGR
jgi:DNA-binding transcriptional LysR family regulator